MPSVRFRPLRLSQSARGVLLPGHRTLRAQGFWRRANILMLLFWSHRVSSFYDSFCCERKKKNLYFVTLKALPQWSALAGKAEVPVPALLALHRQHRRRVGGLQRHHAAEGLCHPAAGGKPADEDRAGGPGSGEPHHGPAGGLGENQARHGEPCLPLPQPLRNPQRNLLFFPALKALLWLSVPIMRTFLFVIKTTLTCHDLKSKANLELFLPRTPRDNHLSQVRRWF